MEESDKKSKVITPYIPFKTFVGFIDNLKSNTVPPIVDHSLLQSMSGSMKGQLLSSLRYLNLIDANNHVLESLKNIVTHYKTDDWGDTLSNIIIRAYHDMIGDVKLESGTSKQLLEAFRKRGNVDGQMLDKAVRFYLSSLDECGFKYSPYFKARKARKTGPRKTKNGKKKTQKENHDDLDDDLEEEDEAPGAKRVKVNIDIPGKKSVSIYLPADMDNEDWSMVKTMLEAYVKRLTNVGGES